MNPKQYKQMMDYLTRKGIKKPFTPASAIERPKKVLEIEAFKDFNKRNPKADGGRIGFLKGELVKIGPQKGKIRVQNIGKKLPGGSRAAEFFKNMEEANAAIKEHEATKGKAASDFKRAFSGVTKKHEDIAQKVYGKSMKELYEAGGTDRNLFNNIKKEQVKETTVAGKGQKTKGNISVTTKDVKQPDGSIKKIETGVKYPNKKVEKEFKKAVRNIFKEPQGVIKYKTLAEDFPITERQAVRAAKLIKDQEGLKFVKGRTSQEYIKEVRNPLIEKTDSPKVLRRIGLEKQRFLKDKPEVFGKIDTAHRASKSHMARLGLQFDTQLVGMDSRLINQVVLKPAENMLERLYTKRENILDNIKGKPTKEQKKILQEINDSVKKVVKTTSGRFVGIIVDPNTLEPSFSGIKKDLAFSKVNKTMKEIEKLPGAPDRRGGGFTKDSEYFKFIKDNVQKSVSGEVKRGFVPNDFKVILSDPKNRKNLLDYAKKNTPDIFSKFKQILNNPTSTRRFALYSKLPAVAIPAGIAMSLISDEAQAADGAQTPGFTTGEKLAGAGTAAAAFKFRKPIIRGAKAVGRGALKVLGPLTVPIELGFIGSNLKSGATVPEALADVVMAGGIFRERDKRKFIEDKYGTETLNRYVAAKTPGITDVMDMPTALPALSQELQAIDAEADAYLQTLRGQRAEEFKRKSALPKPQIDAFQAAEGGLIGKKSGPPPISGPTPHGDEGLPAAFKRVKKG